MTSRCGPRQGLIGYEAPPQNPVRFQESKLSIDALTITDSGERIVPQTKEDWTDWVSATATRNYVLDDPLIDWLNLYGEDNGFKSDFELPGYDPRTDFSRFVMDKGTEFEHAVVKHLETLLPIYNVAKNPMESRDLKAAERTFEAMRRGERAISQAVLRDAESRTYGLADLLIRSDKLYRLFPGSVTKQESAVSAPDLDVSAWHYRVIDIKFTTLHFYSGGGLSDSTGSAWAYKIQVHIYNRALGRLQGYLPPEAFLLGRGWEQTIKGESFRGTSCLDRLGAVPQGYASRSKGSVGSMADAAISWVRRARTKGGNWQVLPEPSTPELRPNMGSTSDQPWHYAKQQIGSELEDLTLLWQVGLKGRTLAHQASVFRWSDPACVSSAVGVAGAKRAPTLDVMLKVNRSLDGPPVVPEHITSPDPEWRKEPPLEFFVDFETVSDLDDDFSFIPERGGQPLIFMIGCGHVEHGEWKWEGFTADSLTEPAEEEIIDSWFAHMAEVKQRIDPNGAEPLVFHRSHAEQSMFETAFNSAKERHPTNGWPDPHWYDFLKLVIREEPVVVRGGFGFGLKSIANGMHSHGLIETAWDASPTDGLGAMVGAWWGASEARRRDCSLGEVEMITEIQDYNEVDCKVMMELIKYLRTNH